MRRSRTHRTERTLAWVSFSVGGEAAIVAVATSFMLIHQKSVRDDGCAANKVCDATGVAANATIGTLVPWNSAAWIVAAAGAGAGIVLYLVSGKDDGSRTALTVAPAERGAILGLHGAF